MATALLVLAAIAIACDATAASAPIGSVVQEIALPQRISRIPRNTRNNKDNNNDSCRKIG